MAAKKITVVISQSPGKNPTKRNLEEDIAAALILEPDVDVSLVPHLNDLTADHSGMLFLRGVPGNMVVLSWLYPRAARWILDRNGVKGHAGQTLLKSADEEDAGDDAAGEQESAEEGEKNPDALGAWNVPNRKIYCIDLRAQSAPAAYLDEIRRIARESTVQTVDLISWINGNPRADQLQRYLHPVAGSPAAANGNGSGNGNGNGASQVQVPGTILKIDLTGGAAAGAEEAVRRRWYPVIDYSRCTNCMECIDFCLFGVYGLDAQERILVEQQDNCKKGCPACSRVCPANAIIFPEHKSDTIAGAETGSAQGFKIDLSKLFGQPTALELAVQERDVELVRDGREAVGASVGLPKRQAGKTQSHDALDDLMDGLDQLDL
jgi:NAD-dependent dihydropyrimidine dehydrogenase PreA subunit